jgi:hypothetical protein
MLFRRTGVVVFLVFAGTVVPGTEGFMSRRRTAT